jgi:hypothetical protein
MWSVLKSSKDNDSKYNPAKGVSGIVMSYFPWVGKHSAIVFPCLFWECSSKLMKYKHDLRISKARFSALRWCTRGDELQTGINTSGYRYKWHPVAHEWLPADGAHDRFCGLVGLWLTFASFWFILCCISFAFLRSPSTLWYFAWSTVNFVVYRMGYAYVAHCK